MSDLRPGVTRYPLHGQQPPARSKPGDVAVSTVFLCGAVALAPLLYGADFLPAVVVALVGTLVPPATVRLPVLGRLVVIVAASVTAGAWAADGTVRSWGYVVTLVAALTLGGTLLSRLLFRRWWTRRQASAEGAPPSGLDPRGEKNVGVLALWQDENYEYEAVDPDLDLVLDAVQALNGGARSSVSVFRGRGRLDVGGDAAGLMVVQQSDDRRNWHQVLDPTAPDASSVAKGKVHVVVGGVWLPYAPRELTRLPEAETAVRAWLTDGERAPSLTWRADTTWGTALRPRYLTLTD